MRCEAHLGCSSGVIKLAELPTSTKGADREKRLGNLNGFTGGSFAGMVYHPAWLSPSLTTMGGGGRMPHIVVIYEDRTTS